MHSGVEVLLVHWPINPEAPFQFDLSFCTSYSRDKVDQKELKALIQTFQPDLILCSGWMDDLYVSICRSWHGKVPTVLSMDNHWTGSLRQQVARMIAPFTILKTFSHAFVPGHIQKEYAVKLGFKPHNIKLGFYSADVDRFDAYYKQFSKDFSNPIRFLYLGRYAEHKGISDLWSAFVQVKEKHPEVELWCVGTGDMYEDRLEADGIKHFGFVQPGDLLPILRSCQVYILPSHFEPWGVSVHEMAVTGFPMILSSAIGSKEAFLKERENGFVFKSGDVSSLGKAMREFLKLSQEERFKMSGVSRNLSVVNSPKIWVSNLKSMMN